MKKGGPLLAASDREEGEEGREGGREHSEECCSPDDGSSPFYKRRVRPAATAERRSKTGHLNPNVVNKGLSCIECAPRLET